MAPIGYRLPNTIFRYAFTVSWPHQIALVMLTIITFLLEVRTAGDPAACRQ